MVCKDVVAAVFGAVGAGFASVHFDLLSPYVGLGSGVGPSLGLEHVLGGGEIGDIGVEISGNDGGHGVLGIELGGEGLEKVIGG